MEKGEVSKFQGLLVGQIIASAVGALLLAVSDCGGYYYMKYYSGIKVWGDIYLGSGILASVLILTGMAGLLVALMAAVNSIKAKENLTADLLKQNARRSIIAAGFTASLAALGALIFAVTSTIDQTDWWLDSGFYGAFIGGLLTVFFGRIMVNSELMLP